MDKITNRKPGHAADVMEMKMPRVICRCPRDSAGHYPFRTSCPKALWARDFSMDVLISITHQANGPDCSLDNASAWGTDSSLTKGVTRDTSRVY